MSSLRKVNFNEKSGLYYNFRGVISLKMDFSE
ncbi:hypothetical protein CYPRO_0671 [Cyclonatronum proteinivorum]|uniref:Uncharacterized protein n=1 Tax=Cyclonatronum proteinivorum TaxID=1457365 RepID=A0A345UHK3_9BACT|nr:hypothetical protein CYPRO_0671 [Cyclonatronum proteinivorum]